MTSIALIVIAGVIFVYFYLICLAMLSGKISRQEEKDNDRQGNFEET